VLKLAFFLIFFKSLHWSQAVDTETNSTAFHVTGLAPFTTYSFRVSAVNVHGVSPLSKVSYYMLTHREGKSSCAYEFLKKIAPKRSPTPFLSK
jgi:hypothetical protein